MNIFRLSKIILLLLLLILIAGFDAAANTVVDSEGSTWRSNSVNTGNGMQVRIDITFKDESTLTFWPAISAGDNIDSSLYCFDSQVWMVWSRERTALPSTYDILQLRLYSNGTWGTRVFVTKATGSVDYSDHKPSGAACPLGHHIAFQRETPLADGTRRKIIYVNNVIGNGSSDGTWTNAVPEEIPLAVGRDGTDVTLLLGNNDNGSPTMVAFKEWITHYYLSGMKRREARISLWKRTVDSSGDPNPWERVMAHLPENPVVH